VESYIVGRTKVYWFSLPQSVRKT